jgi:predicted chitinase
MANILWKVPQFYSQMDSQVSGQAVRSCRSSTTAMAIKFHKPQALLGSNADDTFLRTVLKYGDTTEPEPQRKAALEYGIKLTNYTNGTPTALLEALKRGPVGVGFLHHGPVSAPRGGGHWILLIGATETHGIFHDPYGELDVVNGGYVKIGSGGKGVRYSWKNFLPRWASPSIGPGFYTTFEPIAAPVAPKPVPDDSPLPISAATLAHIWECRPDQIKASEIQELNAGMECFGITSKPNVRHFLAQISHESGGGRWMEELASGAAYEGRTDLGNVLPGDGVKFKGAGYLQVTGRFNYTKLAVALNDPKVVDLGCEYVAQTYPATSAAWWWKEIGRLNELVGPATTVLEVTKVVNGGTNGLRERERYFRRTLDVI